MSLSKLVSLLHTGTLHFSRSDRLGDPFEGSWARIQPVRDYLASLVPDLALEKERRKVMWQANRESAAVSCWHLSEHESAAMWSQYGNSGIAVRTTFERLVRSLPHREPGPTPAHPILVGRVQYIDYETSSVPEDNGYWPFMHKRMSFAHEQEIRAVVLIRGNEHRNLPELGLTAATGRIPESGVDVSVDLTTLLERVHVAPAADVWFADAVRAVLSKFEPTVEVVHSDLDANPIV